MIGQVSATNYPVNNAYLDYYVDSISGTVSGTSLLYSYYDKSITPSLTRIAFGIIDTSSIPDTDEISSATFNFYSTSYLSSKGVTKIYDVWIWNASSSSYQTLSNGHSVTWSSGTNSIILSSSELSLISKTGYSIFRITAVEPSNSGQYRRMSITAYESNPSNAMFLDVTHASASICYCNDNYCEGDGDWVLTENVICPDGESVPLEGNLILNGYDLLVSELMTDNEFIFGDS